MMATVPNDPVAHLMYYLNCICSLLIMDNDATINQFRRHDQYYHLPAREINTLIQLCILFKPDLLLDKCIFQSDAMCGDSLNRFYDIESVSESNLLVPENIMVGGIYRQVKTIMSFKMLWLNENYSEPLATLMKQQRRAKLEYDRQERLEIERQQALECGRQYRLETQRLEYERGRQAMLEMQRQQNLEYIRQERLEIERIQTQEYMRQHGLELERQQTLEYERQILKIERQKTLEYETQDRLETQKQQRLKYKRRESMLIKQRQQKLEYESKERLEMPQERLDRLERQLELDCQSKQFQQSSLCNIL